jgi:dCMP deaminase
MPNNSHSLGVHSVSEQEILDCVTKDFQKRWVTIINGFYEYVSQALLGRPFFLLVYIDAPLLIRWARYKDRYVQGCLLDCSELIKYRCSTRGDPQPNIEDFVLQNDNHIYNPSYGICHARHQAHLGILNSSDSLSRLHLHLKSINLADESRLRPTWDQYFMELASLASLRSNCMKRRVGCVLIREIRVISTGYNGTPRGLKNCNQGGCR